MFDKVAMPQVSCMKQMHSTTGVFNTHGVVVQRMIDKVIDVADLVNSKGSSPYLGGFTSKCNICFTVIIVSIPPQSF